MHTDPPTAPAGVLLACDNAGAPLPDPDAAPDAGWRWLHLAQAHPETRARLARTVPESVATALLAEHTRPGCDVRPGGVLFIGRGVNLDPESTPEDMVSIRAWLEPDRLITVVVRRLRSAEAVSDAFAGTDPPTTPAEVLVRLLSEMVGRIDTTVQEIADALDDMQQEVIDESSRTPTTSELAPLRLRAITMHRYLVPLLDAAATLADAPAVTDAPRAVESLRGVRERLRRLSEDLTAIDARATVTREEIASQASDLLNRRVYALTILAALFLPLTVLTGALGMNVGGVPFGDTPMGFALTTGILLVLVGASAALLRWIKWI
jgi:zinc transporter